MDKKILFRTDKVSGLCDEITIKKLTVHVNEGELCILRSKAPLAMFKLVMGEFVPDKGVIGLAGINVTERNRNERRVFEIPSNVPDMNTRDYLKAALCDNVNAPTVLEERRSEIKSRIQALRAECKKCNSDDRDKINEKIKQANLDYTALGLKINRRKTELELNQKTAKALLESLKKDRLSGNEETIEKLKAKAFSTQFEYSLFMHKKLPDSLVSSRISYVADKLEIPNNTYENKALSAFACAFVKAPVLMAFYGTPDENTLKEFFELVQKHGISIVIVSDKDYEPSCGVVFDVADECVSIRDAAQTTD